MEDSPKDKRMENIYKELFNKIDTDKNGTIDFAELSTWLTSCI